MLLLLVDQSITTNDKLGSALVLVTTFVVEVFAEFGIPLAEFGIYVI